MNMLISSAGRRVGLIECFRAALAEVDLCGKIVAVDASETAPALFFADVRARVPRCLDPRFIPAIRELCERHEVDVIVPTIDTELQILAAHRNELRTSGATLWLSSEEAIEIAADKRTTNRWLRNNGFPTVDQFTPAEALDLWSEIHTPLITKPPRGSASIGVRRILNRSELEASINQDVVVEAFAPGVEYTVHVWADARGRSLCAVPCRRLEVRAGEVSKGRTEKHRGLMRLASDIVDALPGCRGPLNVQIFLDCLGKMRVIEINPRFGGGYPLVDRAGASFARWIVDPNGEPIHYFDDWLDGLTMLRFDSAVYTQPDSLQTLHAPIDKSSHPLRLRS